MKALLVTHINATCQDCGKEFDDYKKPNAPSEHAIKYKHKVTGEVVYAFTIDHREKKK